MRGVAILVVLCATLAFAQGPANVLIVINENSAVSKSIGEYYARRRGIPVRNICRIQTSEEEEIPRPDYDREIAHPVAECIEKRELTESILYIVTTLGVPLRIPGTGSGMNVDTAAVDSELTVLYADIHSGSPHRVMAPIPNPYFGKRDVKFSHPEFHMYLVTRLAAYDFEGVKAMIDRSLRAVNKGKFVIDLKSPNDEAGNDWLRDAAIRLPKERVIFDESNTVLYDQTDVIGYAAWGSNDPNRHRRFLGFKWLPGAIATEFVSTNARTFKRPPENWNISDWKSPALWFVGSPQTMSADYILEGATGMSGHVYEPYLEMCPRPEFLLPNYFSGRNLAESYYSAIRGLSWQNIVIGDPLCSLAGKK